MLHLTWALFKDTDEKIQSDHNIEDAADNANNDEDTTVMCNLLEVVLCFVLLCDGPWSVRLGLIYGEESYCLNKIEFSSESLIFVDKTKHTDASKSIGTEDM